MKITVINATEKHGATYRLKELFLEQFKDRAEIAEFYLPRDCPAFCAGCISCILKGESTCKDAEKTSVIERALLDADLIVMASPAYVCHTTGAMKAMLDHFAYRWMPHRPAPELFGKRAVILTQCLGAGAQSTAKDIRHSLSWWGISKIGVFSGALMGGVVWEELPAKRRAKLARKIQRLSEKFARMDYSRPARIGFAVKTKFLFCRAMQKSLYEKDPEYLDAKYWAQQGWLGRARPWKQGK